MPEVRVRRGTPIPSDFAGSKGTSIVVDEDSGRLYVMTSQGAVKDCTAARWGEIVGTLAEQSDVESALSGKAADDHNHSGVYDPAGTASAAAAAALQLAFAADFSGEYGDLSGKPALGTAASKDVGTGAGDVAAGDHSHPGGSGAAWGGVTGTLADQTDLQAALDAKAASDHDHDADYCAADDARLSDARTPTAHSQAISTITGLQTALDGKQAAGSYEPANANIQQHVAAAHAPSNAQKNSDITKAEIEAKLTGEINTHTHPGGGADPWTYRRLPADCTISTTAAGDVTNGGVLFGFTPAANTSYIWEAVIGLRTATATVNPRLGFAWSTGMTDGVCSIEQTSTATAKIMANGNIAAALLVAVGGIPTNTTSWPAICYGAVMAGATPSGNCRMQLASETAGVIVRVVASISYFRYRALP